RKQSKFGEARGTLAQAEKLAEGGPPDLLQQVKLALDDLDLVEKLDRIRYRKWMYVAEPGGKGRFNTQAAPGEYRPALKAAGLDLGALESGEGVKQITGSAVKAELVAAVDDWALYERDEVLRDRLLEVARRADPHPWTERLRRPALWTDRDAVA